MLAVEPAVKQPVLAPRRCQEWLYLLAMLGVVAARGSLLGQTFEVASIKTVKPEMLRTRGLSCGFGDGGRFIALGTVEFIVACAYEIPPARARQEIAGLPKWGGEDLFEIVAVAPADTFPSSLSERLKLLQVLLSDRFKLVVHRDKKEVPVYALAVGRKDGRIGPRLYHTETTCLAWIGEGRHGEPPSIGGDLPCGRQRVSAGAIRATTMTLAQLANLLTSRLDRPVEDRTGLSGPYHIDLQWRPERAREPDKEAAPVLDDLPTSLFTAVQEQLGLKLVPSRGLIDKLIIDHIGRPTPN